MRDLSIQMSSFDLTYVATLHEWRSESADIGFYIAQMEDGTPTILVLVDDGKNIFGGQFHTRLSPFAAMFSFVLEAAGLQKIGESVTIDADEDFWQDLLYFMDTYGDSGTFRDYGENEA